MFELQKNSPLTVIKEYLFMTVGMLVYSFGWICCILPSDCAGGGATGLSLLIYHITGGVVSVGVMVFIINTILLIIAGFIVGWRFGIKTIYCVVVMSIAMWALQRGFTLPDGSVMDLFQLDNRLLSAILGGLFAGVGVAICFQQGGSTGGSDIVVMIVNKFYKISYGRFIRMTDTVIISLALFLPDVGIAGVIYGFVQVAVFSYTVDMIMSGNQQSSQIFIVSKDYVAMADAMNQVAHRGATVIDATGWYSKERHKIVMVVCRKRDTSMVMKTAKMVDSEAFITVGSVMGVYGKGFDALNKV
ncbi:MAG: YitT family protein [Alistipes sp.]|nr:YitT family protein [Alistipes sp.]